MNTMKRDVDGGIINRSGDGTYCRDYYAILFLSTAIVEVETVEREREREREIQQCRINPDSNGFANGADGSLPPRAHASNLPRLRVIYWEPRTEVWP